jgi:hypothetical protein
MEIADLNDFLVEYATGLTKEQVEQDGTAISTETTSYMPAGDSEYTLQTVTFTTASNETHAVIKIGINTAGTVQTMTVKDLTLTEA